MMTNDSNDLKVCVFKVFFLGNTGDFGRKLSLLLVFLLDQFTLGC